MIRRFALIGLAVATNSLGAQEFSRPQCQQLQRYRDQGALVSALNSSLRNAQQLRIWEEGLADLKEARADYATSWTAVYASRGGKGMVELIQAADDAKEIAMDLSGEIGALVSMPGSIATIAIKAFTAANSRDYSDVVEEIVVHQMKSVANRLNPAGAAMVSVARAAENARRNSQGWMTLQSEHQRALQTYDAAIRAHQEKISALRAGSLAQVSSRQLNDIRIGIDREFMSGRCKWMATIGR